MSKYAPVATKGIGDSVSPGSATDTFTLWRASGNR